MNYTRRPVVIEPDIDATPTTDDPMDWVSGLILLTVVFAIGLGIGLVVAGDGSGLFGKLA